MLVAERAEIIEEVFADYMGKSEAQGKLAPVWRWDLADVAAYPQRSLSIQYNESDLQFITRLLREEGLFFWFEHTGQPEDASLGAHTLVIADHNNAFKPGPQPRVRFTQSAAVQPEDTLTRWREAAATQTATLDLASLDHRSLGLRPQSQSADATTGTAPHPELGLTDNPGAYAYEDSQQGARLALRQMQAIDALRAQVQASGTLRVSAPGTTFTLTDHAQHDGRDASRDRFVMLGVRHSARNNLSADQRAQVEGIGAAIGQINARSEAGHTEHHRFGQAPARNVGGANATEEPLYQCHISAQRAAVPVRLGARDKHGLPDPRSHPRPSVQGVQTAIVVGLGGAPIHTDRDQRIKLQFHWQRGANASHRIPHPAGDNAAASDASGTWVRVAQTVAGANWGAVFTPRLGQEVLVQFIAGDIDRPVVIGAAYNGQGSADAQGNQNAAGAATATGNAPAWFPGTARQGELQAHAHTAVLAGHKSQELSTSQGGSGGYNQLVFDDTPGASRIELASTSAQTRLQLGHLLNQNDNQRLQARGHGLDLSTAAWGAVRAGAGILISAHGKSGSQSATRSLDSREPQAQIEQSQQLLHTLAESAQQHQAKATDEPDVIGAKKEDKAKQLGNEQGLYAAIDSLGTSDKRGQAAQGEGNDSGRTGGGIGDAIVWPRPDIVIAAPGGIASFTPATAFMTAGNTMTMVAGQDLQHITQGNAAASVKSGLIFYTYGKTTVAAKPNQETGIKLHAASGNVRVEAQTDAVKITADKAVEVASTNGMVRITAPNHILLTAGGAALDIQAGSITLKGPGILTGPGSASQSLELKTAELKGCQTRLAAAGQNGAAGVQR